MVAKISGGILLSEIAEITGGTLSGQDKKIFSISTDSREVSKDCLFLAIKGEKFDGHSFIKNSAQKGMAAFMCEYIPEGCDELSCVVVGDVISCLGKIARFHKAKYNVLTVAVTGSVGKTTTKEFVYSVLSNKYKTVKTEGNHNNFIGLPMTLFSIDENTEAAVIEMGMSSRGEIDYLSKIVQPDIAIITNIGTSHIENLGSREEIANAKLEIKSGLSECGKLFVNGDEPLIAQEDFAVKIGKGEKCDFRVDNIAEGDNGCAFDIVTKDEIYESVVIPAFGEHNVMNAAFAYAVGKCACMGEYEIRRGLLGYKTTGMRQNMYSKQGITIIEDCYNASPESMIASLKVLSNMAYRQNKRSVAVLGDMLELGNYSEEGHRKVGAAAGLNNIGLLVTFGKDATNIAKAAVDFGIDADKVFMYEDTQKPEAVGEFVLKNTSENDIILFKASRGIQLERVIEYINISRERKGYDQ